MNPNLVSLSCYVNAPTMTRFVDALGNDSYGIDSESGRRFVLTMCADSTEVAVSRQSPGDPVRTDRHQAMTHDQLRDALAEGFAWVLSGSKVRITP